MPFNQVFNNVTYPVPSQGDPAPWGPPMDRYLAALGTFAFSPAGGSYPLTADLNLGTNFGLIAAYYKSSTTNIATAGVLRLAKTDSIDWRNNANSGNNVLAVDGSDNLTYNGTALQPTLGALPDGEIWIGNGSSVATPQTLSGAITTTDTGVTSISSGYITNTMVNSSAAIAYSKLNLSGSIVNADIFSGAAIAYSKLNLTGGIVNADVNASAAIDFSKLAALTSAHILVGNGSAVATDVALSGDATLANTGALTLATVNSDVGSFTLANITVDATGRITAASNGSAGAGTVTSVSGTTNQITSTNPTTTPVLALASPLTLPGAMTAGGAIAMAANKITGLANGTASTDATAYGQVQYLQNAVQFTTTTIHTTSSASYEATALTASITPTSASSRIKITAIGSISCGPSVLNNISIFRGITNLAAANGFTRFETGTTVGTGDQSPVSISFIDSPATTSSTTYTLEVQQVSGSGSTVWGDTNVTQVLILEELR